MIEPSPAKIYSISELNRIVRGLLETRLADIWISGEITNFSRPASGHWYFTLKDDNAQIRCAMFRNRNRYLRLEPGNGIKVQAMGRVSLYEPRGDYQFIVEEIETAGEGALQRAFERLKQRLWEEGLFDERYKKPLPALPRKVGVITSPTGAAIRDILNVLKRRYPLLDVIIYPVPVQGADAAPQIAQMIEYANSRQECDLLLLSRGGGSIEDLWAFNEEEVARAIFACEMPLITGVGHEIDFTIAEFVSDVRAPTPSAAAELITPSREDLQDKLEKMTGTLKSSQSLRINQASKNLQWLKKTLNFHHPREHIQRQAQQVDDFQRRLINSIPGQQQRRRDRVVIATHMLVQYSPAEILTGIKAKHSHLQDRFSRSTQIHLISLQQQLDNIHTRLSLLNPMATLERGYAIIHELQSGRVIKGIEQLKKGDKISGNVINGEFIATIETTNQ